MAAGRGDGGGKRDESERDKREEEIERACCNLVGPNAGYSDLTMH